MERQGQSDHSIFPETRESFRFKAEITPSGFWSKSSLDLSVDFSVDFFLLVFQGKWPDKSTKKLSDPKKSTAETKHQNPRLISGTGCP